MGGLARKRLRAEYDPVDNEIQFNKRARPFVRPPAKVHKPIHKRANKPKVATEPERRSLRIRRNSFESADGSESSRDSCRSSSSDAIDEDISFKPTDFSRLFPSLPSPTPKRAAAVSTEPPPASPPSTALSVSSEDADTSVEDEVDDREMNRRSPNGFLLPDPLPKGEVLTDSGRQEWVLGKAIGVGGFGELYLASAKLPDGQLSPKNYVIKIEPHSNGPLFVEVHFYIRATKPDQISAFKQRNRLKHLGIPSYIGSGGHIKGGQRYRFLVMERFGSDLQRILDNSEGGRLTDKTVCEVGLQVIDALQYIHQQGYVHKDVKASNLLVGMGGEGQHKVNLVDYGLCSRYIVGGVHKQYTHDLRWAHEGTLEYTSRDAHIGCASRRGDIEVLAYNLVEWWGGCLPWDREFATPNTAKIAKFRAFADPQKFLRHCFRKCGNNNSSSSSGKATATVGSGSGVVYPVCLLEMFKYVGGLRFEEAPDYNHLRDILRKEMRKRGLTRNGRLEFKLGSAVAPAGSLAENETFLRPLADPETRISAIFDKLCVSSTTWEQSRESLRRTRDEASLANPTPAMLEVMQRISERESNLVNAASAARKRNKSGGYYGEGSDYTPAMLEIIARRKKARGGNGGDVGGHKAEIVASSRFSKSLTSLSSSQPSAVQPTAASPSLADSTASLYNRRTNGLQRTRSRELSRLDPFLPASLASAAQARELGRLTDYLADPATDDKRKTRSADISTEASRNLRSAFRYGLGNVKSLLRQVSDSFTNMF